MNPDLPNKGKNYSKQRALDDTALKDKSAQYKSGFKRRLGNDTLLWIETYHPKIRLPGKGLVSYEPFWCQQQVLRDKSRFRHVNKSRQIGFTTTFAIEAVHSFIYKPQAEIIVLSKSEKEAKKFLDKFYIAYDSVSEDMGLKPLAKQNTLNAESATGSTIQVLTSSKGAGRSFTCTDFYMDEVAHTTFGDDIYQASMPTIATTGGRVTLFSSPKGRAGIFAEIGKNLEDQGFSGHIYEWWFSPVYNPNYEEFLQSHLNFDHRTKNRLIDEAKQGSWYTMMRSKYSDMAWGQEFEASYDSDVDTVFSAVQLKRGFKKPDWMDIDIDPNNLALEYLATDSVEGHDYVTGIDLGRKRDATVIVTFDTSVDPMEMVEYKRIPPASSDWGLIELSIRQTYDKFKSDMIHDATGVGDSISERVIDISEPFIITASSKYNVIENLRRAMDAEAIKLPRIPRMWREFEQFKWDDKHLVQDIVIAVCLATKVFYEPDTVWVGADDFSYVGE